MYISRMKTLTLIRVMCFCLTFIAQDLSLTLQQKLKFISEEQSEQWTMTPHGLNLSLASSNLRFFSQTSPQIEIHKSWSVVA